MSVSCGTAPIQTSYPDDRVRTAAGRGTNKASVRFGMTSQ